MRERGVALVLPPTNGFLCRLSPKEEKETDISIVSFFTPEGGWKKEPVWNQERARER